MRLLERFAPLGNQALISIEYRQQLEERARELRAANDALETSHLQLLQSEKMASIGQLAAGVAHEINNPVGFVLSNLGSLAHYLDDFLEVLSAYERLEAELPPSLPGLSALRALKARVDLGYLRRDVLLLLQESHDGCTRVRDIVQDLKDFSRAGGAEVWQAANVEAGLDSTLNITANELKYKAELVKEFAGVPDIECLPSQLNQVFLNLIVNAAQAIEQGGKVWVRTGREGDAIWVEVADDGRGIPAENLGRIFDPFFTTKPVGQGTGLGLALSYGIVRKHNGRIEVDSKPGCGSRFRVWLPIRQVAAGTEETHRRDP
ncbi:MAG: ATPase [Rhodocyclales bacterium RIFCSPLOWO2_02_FULL_63_24]|nr:MAG: ATPase [Rhodocyclales bacterium RIFCSPLOWO2_02_FULL_63_24]